MRKIKAGLPIAIGLIVVNILFWIVIGRLFIPTEWRKDYISSNLVTAAQNIVGVTVFSLLTVKIFKIKTGFGRKNLFKGVFWYGLVMWIAIAANLIMSYRTPQKSFAEALPGILVTLFTNMTIGAMEEVVYRGMIFGLFRESFGESKKGIYLSVFASAMVFGGIHVVNLIFSPELIITTIAQVIYAIFYGIILAVIYFRSENILPGIILHGLFDFAAYIWICFASNTNEAFRAERTTDMNVISALVTIAMVSTFVISGLWQLRTVFCKKNVI